VQVWAFCLDCAEGFLIICSTDGFHEPSPLAQCSPLISGAAEARQQQRWLLLLESRAAQLRALVSVLLDANVVLISWSLGSLCCGCCSFGVLLVLDRQLQNMGGSS